MRDPGPMVTNYGYTVCKRPGASWLHGFGPWGPNGYLVKSTPRDREFRRVRATSGFLGLLDSCQIHGTCNTTSTNIYKHSSCVVANPPKGVYTPAAPKPMISLES